MFTVAQIKLAHSKVKSGADFPAYIREIKALGVTYYETFVSDGHTDYSGAKGYQTVSPPKYDLLPIADQSDAKQFRQALKAHQAGQTDYLTFCNQCAGMGIHKWAVCLEQMTCTYYDKKGQLLLVEEIPG